MTRFTRESTFWAMPILCDPWHGTTWSVNFQFIQQMQVLYIPIQGEALHTILPRPSIRAHQMPDLVGI